jgi:hypothetical protein
MQLSIVFAADESNATDIIDVLTNTILKPLITQQEDDSIDPEDLFIINAFQSEPDPEDYSSETEVTTTVMTSETTMSESETNEILEKTANYHNMRVKIVNLTHTVRKQQEIITHQIKKYHDLENSGKRKKVSSDKKLSELKMMNEKCRIDFNSVSSDLRVAKRLISMEKYSHGLKNKLGEFGVVNLV